MINQYKRSDVFRCNQDAHKRFDGRVSVYHVLKEKKCHPEGCLYFLWHCALMEKGQHCVRGFNFVGRECKGCSYFMDEKIHLQPTVLLDSASFSQFLDDLDSFESWIEDIAYKRVNVAGKIDSVKPWFEQFIESGRSRCKLRGYLLVIKEGFIGLTAFHDAFYVRVSEALMKNRQFRPGMQLELNGELREDRGRLIIHFPKQIEIQSKGTGQAWTRENAIVAVKTATLLKEQPDQCLECQWGALTDVHADRGKESERFRYLYCLKGISNSEGCYIHVMQGKQQIL